MLCRPSGVSPENQFDSICVAFSRRFTVAVLSWAVLLVLTASSASGQTAGRPPDRSPTVEAKQIILLIGDGMGYEHIRAAGIYLTGSEGTLSFESFPYQAELTTYCANDPTTDSAAASTAMATGHKVDKRVISVALPGDGAELETILEFLGQKGYRTGLVTTTFNADATPAAFGAHEPDRDSVQQIADDYYFQSRPNVIFGGGAYGLSEPESLAAGYEVVTDVLGLFALDASVASMANGLFGSGVLPFEYDGDFSSIPHLSEMAAVALEILGHEPAGLFLMIEGGLIDKASHANELERAIFETLEFDKTVQVVTEWAAGRDDTLVIVTADHETGGLNVTQNNGEGNWPDVTWSTLAHTSVNVPIYASGPGAELIVGLLDNTDVPGVMKFAAGVPRFTSDPVRPLFAAMNEPYVGSIADFAIDISQESLVFSLLSGPSWLELAEDGSLSGTPGAQQVGPNSWNVQVDDGNDGSASATLELTVCESGPTTWYPDVDADGRGDPNHLLSACEPPAGFVTNGDDCNDSDGSSWGMPAVVDGLALEKLPDGMALTWISQAATAGAGTVYDIATGQLNDLLGSGAFSGTTCLASDVVNPSYVDTRNPDGPGDYFLLQATNSCGSSTFGDSSVTPDPRDELDTAGVCP